MNGIKIQTMNKRLSMDDTSPIDFIPAPEDLAGITTCSLPEIFDIFGSDKGSVDNAHRYGERYANILACLPHNLVISEIGVACGASLRAFSAYRPSGSIFGYDIRPECDNLLSDCKNVKIYIQDCTKSQPNHLSHLIIDDGSHISEDIVETFRLAWPKLIPGGFYVIEDLACTYNERYTQKHNSTFGRSVKNDRHYFLTMVDSLMKSIDSRRHGVESFHYSRELLMIQKSHRF